MAYYGRSSASIFDGFTLSPLPYPVFFILLVVLLLLSFSWSSSYEDFIESAQEKMSWTLFATPVTLLILIRCLSAMQRPFDGFMGFNSPYDRRRRSYYGWSDEGSSPWGVAAIVVLLLVLVSYHSSIKDMWRP